MVRMFTPVIAFDLDGTLIRPDKTIHPLDVEVLAGGFEPMFIPVTARTLHSVKRCFQRYGILSGNTISFPVVTQYGSVLYGNNERLVRSRCFTIDTAHRLVDTMKAFASVTSWLYTPDKVLTLHSDRFSEQAGEEFDFALTPFCDDSGVAFTKASAVSPNLSEIERFSEAIRTLECDASYYRPSILEICPQGVDKGNGLQHLIQELGISRPLVFAAGDTAYDLPMFRVADRSYAPRTASPEVRDAASRVIDVEKNGLLQPVLTDLRQL